MNETEQAKKLANNVLDTPNRDPDDDLSMMSRQFLRRLEEVTALKREREYLRAALEGFRNAFGNDRQTSSLHDWNQRLKRADECARIALAGEPT